jgi:hypothetical protein
MGVLHVNTSTMILHMFSDETAQGWGLTTKNQQANHNSTGLLHADQSSVDRQSLTTLGQGGDGQGIPGCEVVCLAMQTKGGLGRWKMCWIRKRYT